MANLIPVACPRCQGNDVFHEYQVPVIQKIYGFDPEIADFDYGEQRIDDETVLDDRDGRGRFRMWCNHCLERFWFDPETLRSEVD